jgi:hypothetical protein
LLGGELERAFYIMEIWKDVPGYQGSYQISNLGKVKSLKLGKERILKQSLNTHGYLQVGLCGDSKIKIIRIHQMVAMTFLNHVPCGHKFVVNHKNFIRTDNRAENLEIVTNRENTNKNHLKSTSNYTGVSWHKPSNKWISFISINGKNKNLGYFVNELDASKAYQKALKKLSIY